MAIKHVLLDLDDTVLDFHRAERAAITETFLEFSLDPSEEVLSLYSSINKSCWRELELGTMTREEVLHQRFARLFAALGKTVDCIAVQKKYEYNLSFKAFFLDGAEELLEKLRGKYKLYVASNGTARVQDRRIEISGISKYFDGLFISQRIGADKPSPVFFEECFRQMGNPPKDEIIIVGDSLSSDIKGGVLSGIHTCYFNPKRTENHSDILPEHEISSLSELPALLALI